MARVFANVADDELDSGISIGATSSTLTDASEFPATGDFSIRFEDASDPTVFEIVTATARAGNVITHAATANAWDAGDKVYQVVAKADLDEFLQKTQAAAAYQALSEKGVAGGYSAFDATLFKAAIQSAKVDTLQTTPSTSFTDLTTTGPAVTVTISSSGIALVLVSVWVAQATAGALASMGFAISGATTRAAADDDAIGYWPSAGGNAEEVSASGIIPVTGLAAGSTTFTSKYRVTAGTGQFRRRKIAVIPL